MLLSPIYLRGTATADYRLTQGAAVNIQLSRPSEDWFVMSDWRKQRDLLIEESLAFTQRIADNTKLVKPDATVPETSKQKPVTAKDFPPTENPDMERAAIERRVANFTATKRNSSKSAKSIARRPWQRPAPPNGTRWAITADGASIVEM
jgi:hypothetical protein